jgi:hypothetical protein
MLTRLNLKSTRVRVLLALGLAWSVLQAGLIAAIHLFHPTNTLAFLWAAIPALPLCLMIAIVVRLSRSNPDPGSRRFYLYGTMIYASALLIYSLLSVLLMTAFDQTKPRLAWSLIKMPLFCPGLIFAIALFQPLHKIDADSKTSLRMKLAAPLLRWIFRMSIVGVVYLIALLISSMLFDNYELTGIPAFAVALVPVLPIFGLIWVYKRYMQEEQDEFQRHQIHRSILWAFFGTLVIATAIGRLENHSLILHRHTDFFNNFGIFFLYWWLQSKLGFLFTFIPLTRISRQQEKQTP